MGLLLWITLTNNEWALFFLSFILLFFFLILYFKSILQSVLHSSVVEGTSIDPSTADGPSHDVTNDFLVPGCICAIAASEKSTDTVWFVKILKRHEADQPYTDDYSFTVAKGQWFFSGKYLERAGETRQ